MLKFLIAFIGLFYSFSAFSVTPFIEGLIESQNARLTICKPVDSSHPASILMQADYAKVKIASGSKANIELIVSDCPAYGLAVLNSNKIIVGAQLAEWDPEIRAFIIAHELAHVAQDNWSDWLSLYSNIEPTSAEAAIAMGPAVTKLAHHVEFKADVFAKNTLKNMGMDPVKAIKKLFALAGAQPTSDTHPSSTDRLANVASLFN